jgi:hypothetical protein
VLNSLPPHKTAGPSSITYEMLKLLPDTGRSALLNLCNQCFLQSDIPGDWRLANIYPIPKPHEFEGLLKNTRPITLLETAHKLLVKILYLRLSKVLASHHILQGGNFAGLPGGSTAPPITILDQILRNRRYINTDSPLWIVSQDISKAFDSIDLNMLRLSLLRLKFPVPLIQFLLNLFTRHDNRILMCYGSTHSYRIHIGIDQGEVISPLLWVIYIDPLLTELNRSALFPITLSPSISRDLFTSDSAFPETVALSHLTYMDDSTLMSSSYEGMTQLLSTCQEFYFFNNTAANPSKYTLITSELPNTSINFSLPSTINNPATSFALQSLGATESFRFLGVWFNLKVSPKFVHNQISQEYKELTTIVRWKKLFPAQLTYIHNVVLLPRVEYRSQVTHISESLCKKLSSSFMTLFKNRLCFACSAPSILFSSHLFYNCIPLYTHLMKAKLNFLYKWCNAFSSYFSPNFVLLKLLTLSYLMALP